MPAAEGFPGGAPARGPTHSSKVLGVHRVPLSTGCLSESHRIPDPIPALHRKTVVQGLCSLGIRHKGASTMVLAGFMAFLAEVDVERDQEQQTRTRWSLTGRESEGQT